MNKKVSKNKKKNTNQKKSCEITKYHKPHIPEKDILNNLLEVIPDSIYFKDRESRVIILSKYMLKEKLDMNTPDEAIGKTDFDFFSEEHARQAFEDEQEIIRTGKPIIGIEEKETWPNKPEAWVITTKMPLRDSKGKIIGTFGISRDITRRKEAEIELVKYKEYLENAKQETDNILQNVEEGLFLLDTDFKIGSHYSHALTQILGENKPAERELTSILADKVETKTLESTDRFLRLMFRKDVSEDMLANLNPLSQVMVNIMDENNIWSKSKYLAFKFKRIENKTGDINSLIVTVTDITEEVNLSKQLKENEERSQRQMACLMRILHVDPSLIQEFLEGTDTELNELEQMIQEHGMDGDYKQLLENVFRSIHLIKGNASLLDLKPFVEQTHEFEEKIIELQKNDIIIGTDFVPLVMRLRELKDNLQELRDLLLQLSRLKEHLNEDQAPLDAPTLVTSLDNLVNRLSTSHNKQVSLKYDGFDENIIPYSKRLVIKDVLVQLVRNSMYHGIEIPQERESLGKSSSGIIEISTFTEGSNLGVSFRDDGRGLSLEELHQKARDSGQWKQSEIDCWTDKQVMETIFLPGISTATSTSIIGGRGVGLDLVKKKIEAHNGTISVAFSPSQFCEFIIILPLPKVRLKKKTRARRKSKKETESISVS